MDMTIKQFCEKHGTWGEGRKWTMANLKDMDEVWLAAEPEDIVLIATRKGVLTDEALRLFSVWAAREVQHLMTDRRSRDSADTLLCVTERCVLDNSTSEELKAAFGAFVRVAVKKKKWYKKADPIYSTYAKEAVLWAAITAAGTAPEAARSAAYFAAWAASWKAASSEAGSAAREAQADYLRRNCKPNFEN